MKELTQKQFEKLVDLHGVIVGVKMNGLDLTKTKNSFWLVRCRISHCKLGAYASMNHCHYSHEINYPMPDPRRSRKCTGSAYQFIDIKINPWTILYRPYDKMLAIGCQVHSLEKWKKWTYRSREIKAMSPTAPERWKENKKLVLKLVRMNGQ